MGTDTKALFRMADVHAEVTVFMDDRFFMYLETYIRPHPLPQYKTDRKQLLTYFNTLNCPSVRPALLMIWKCSSAYKAEKGIDKDASPYLTEKALSRSLWKAAQARLDASFKHARAGGSPLPLLTTDEVVSQKMYDQRVKRLVQALIAYGLVEEVKVNGHARPHINGTSRLHDMMVRLEAAQLMLANDVLAKIAHESGQPT